MTTSAPSSRVSGTRVLVILLATYIFNLMDRQIVGVLAVPMKSDLGLSDTQLGLLGGLAFVILYTLLGIPIAWLADRKSRVKIIAVSVGVWSAFTALSGAAQNYWQLFLARVGVGIGEAGGVAPAYSLIADYFPPQRRARALAFFSLGAPIGSALGVLFGGWIASNFHWRAAFISVGLAGLVLVPLVERGIPEPVRGGMDAKRELPRPQTDEPANPARSFTTIARSIAASRAFWLLSFGSAMATVPSSGLVFWLPSFFRRSFELELLDVSYYQGSLMLVGGIVGTWLGGWIGDTVARGRAAGYALTAAAGFLLAVPAFMAALAAQTLTVAWLLFIVWYALILVWLGPTLAAVQNIFEPHMRATASAMFLFINNFIGIGFGAVFLGFMSDQMTARYGEEALRYSMLYSLLLYLVSFALFGLAAWGLKRRPGPTPAAVVLRGAAEAE